ncbi:MAG: dephospho-CoA kinase [Pseudomonadales bacterium]|nr:dephospho-CoA kinase [Pseudomonadales bacterium]
MKILCLTGGIAAGKSTVAMFLEELGAKTIDADKVGHLVYEPGAQAYIKVVEAFGQDIVGEDNHINRRVLGGKVFGKPEALKKLTDIVWPEIRNHIKLEMAGYEAAYPDGVVVLDAAVLFEAGWFDMGDEIWVVVVERELAIERAMARDALDRQAVENRIDAQLSNAEKKEKADVVFENNGTEEALREHVEKEWARFCAL